MIRRVNILVEGQTEETFVKIILGPHLQSRDLLLTPILVTNKQTKHRSHLERGQPARLFKGGIATYQHVKRDLLNILGDKSLTAVSTMIDYYHLPSDFPGFATLPHADCYARVRHLQQALHADINNSRFHPFLTLHEFEALLFAAPHHIVATPEAPTASSNRLAAIREQYETPEEIDEGPETHPAERIRREFKGYRKPIHGVLIANRIGVEKMRQECPHFAEWLNWLESL